MINPKDKDFILISPSTKTGYNEPPADTESTYSFGKYWSLEDAIEDLIEAELDIDPDEEGVFYFWVKKAGELTWTFVTVSADSQIIIRVVENPSKQKDDQAVTNHHFNVKAGDLGAYGYGTDTVLHLDGKNLAQVIANILLINPHKLERYNKLVRQVFSNIEYVSVKRTDQGFSVIIWPPDELDDPLALSGYDEGVGQILAALFVLITADKKTQITIEDRDRLIASSTVSRLCDLAEDYIDPLNGKLDHQITFHRLPPWVAWIGSKLYDLRRADRSEKDGLMAYLDEDKSEWYIKTQPGEFYNSICRSCENTALSREKVELNVNWQLWEKLSMWDEMSNRLGKNQYKISSR